MYELKKTRIRLEKITRTLEQFAEDNNNLRQRLSTRDEPLHKKIKRLEQQLEGMKGLHQAQENVLMSLQSKLDLIENNNKED